MPEPPENTVPDGRDGVPPVGPLPEVGFPTVWDKWKLLGLLGRGGMGMVYEAVPADNPDARPCAVKILSSYPGEPGFQQLVRRFTEREWQLAASIRHPNVIQIDHAGKGADGRPYLAMELLARPPLSALMAQFHEPHRAAGVALGLAKALVALGAKNIVHRDIKPSNLLFRNVNDPPDQVILTDLGIASGPGESFTGKGVFLGTLSYASPEQLISATSANHQSDIYSVGVILFELLAGRLPFDEPANRTTTMFHEAKQRPKRLQPHRPDSPAILGDICQMCLDPDPLKRYESAQDLADELQQAIESTRPQ